MEGATEICSNYSLGELADPRRGSLTYLQSLSSKIGLHSNTDKPPRISTIPFIPRI